MRYSGCQVLNRDRSFNVFVLITQRNFHRGFGGFSFKVRNSFSESFWKIAGPVFMKHLRIGNQSQLAKSSQSNTCNIRVLQNCPILAFMCGDRVDLNMYIHLTSTERIMR